MRRMVLLAVGLAVSSAFLATAQQDSGSGGKRMVAWIKANNKFGPTSKFALQMCEAGEESLEKGNNIMFTFDPGAMKSGQTTLVSVFSGEFFFFPLTAKQSAQLGVKNGSVDFFENKRPDRTQLPLVAQLADLKIDNAGNLGSRKQITGQVSCQNLLNTDDKYAIRLAYRIPPDNVARFHHLDQPLPKRDGVVRFTFPDLVAKDGKPYVGPLPVYLSLCKVSERDGNIQIVLHSNTLATLLNVTGE